MFWGHFSEQRHTSTQGKCSPIKAPPGYSECQSHSPKGVQNTYCSGPNYSVKLRLYVFMYVGRAGLFWGATVLSLYPVPSWVPISLSPQTHEFPCTWFQKGRQEAKSKFHNPTREQGPGGLEFLAKLIVEQNVCLCQQAGTFSRLTWDGGREWGQDRALCFGPVSAESYKTEIQSTLELKQTANASFGWPLPRTISSQSSPVSQNT